MIHMKEKSFKNELFEMYVFVAESKGLMCYV